MKTLRRFFNWLFRRKEKPMYFCSELKIGYRPVNRRDMVPILYRRKK